MRFRRTTLITIACLAALAGIGLSRRFYFVPSGGFVILLPLLLFLRKKNIFSLLIILFLGLGVGLWRGSLYMRHVNDLKSLTGQKITVIAKATSDSVYSTRSQIEFTANNVQLIHPFQGYPLKKIKPLAGSFKISGFGEPMIYRGDIVQVSAKLFPMRGSNQARMAYAKLDRVSADNSLVNDLTRRFDAGMQSALPEPLASFGLGLLIGQRTTLPQDITAALTAVGLVHIIAVSGYNLTIIIRGVSRLKVRSKYQKLVVSLVLIAGFILITGFSASIVRAALVSILGLWAWYYGRQFKPVALITLAAALTGLWNPYYVWGDMGWYLSFLAFFGVLVISPIISAKLFKRSPKLLTMVVIETLSAEIMTLPLILLTFSQLSIVALIANALVVPLVPLAMLLSAVAGTAGAIIPQFAGWLAFPARLLLTYMLDVVHLMSNIPSVLIHRSISLEYMIGIYAAVALALVVTHRKLSKTEPPEELVQITP